MLSDKFTIFVSDYLSKTKEEANNNVIAFKAKLKNKTATRKLLTIYGIKKNILDGRTINCGSFSKSRRIFGLDVDNKGETKMSYLECIRLLKEIDIHPNLIMETMSSIDKERYRVFFTVKNHIQEDLDYKIYLKTIVKYLNCYYPDSTDFVTVSTETIFYPCKSCLFEDLTSYSDISILDRLYPILFGKPYLKIYLTRFFAPILFDQITISKKEMQKILDKDLTLDIYKTDEKPVLRYSYLYSDYKKNNRLIKNMELITRQPIGVPIKKIIERLKPPMDTVFPYPLHIDTYSSKIGHGQNLGFLFNIPINKNIKDIVFEQKNCIARIQKTDFENYKYVLYDSETKKHLKTMSIYEIFQEIFGLKDFNSTIDLIKQFCNIQPSTQKIGNTIGFLKSAVSDKQIEKHKHLKKILCEKDNCLTRDIYLAILDLFRKLYISYEKPITSRTDLQFFANPETIKKELKTSMNIDASITTISTRLALLIKLGLLEKLKPENFNSLMLKIAHNIKSQNFNKKISNVVCIPYYSPKVFKEANQIAKEFFEHNSRIRSYEIKNIDTIYKSPYFVTADSYIKQQLELDSKFIAQQDILHLYKKTYPNTTERTIYDWIIRYKPYLLESNNLEEKVLSINSMWRYRITKEIVKENKFAYKKTKLYIPKKQGEKRLNEQQ